jgi:GNAT superfamily N-acetyltransferase
MALFMEPPTDPAPIDRLDRGDPRIAQLADAFAEEWPDWARSLPRGALEAHFTSAHGTSALPLVLVAHEGGVAVGTIALRPWFGEEAMAETPWVRGFWVRPDRRGAGIGRRLLAAIEHEAWTRGFRRLHVATTTIEATFLHHGYKVFHRVDHGGDPMTWLRKDLGPPKPAHRD